MDILKLARPIVLSGVILLIFIICPYTAHSEQNHPLKNQSKASIIQLSEQQKVDSAKIEQLENIILRQKSSIDDLKEEIQQITNNSNENVTTFNVWSGILLGAAALILAALGIIAAIASIFGYQEIKKSFTEKAQIVATDAAKKRVDELIENGEFDAVVQEIIDKLMYRGIRSTEEETEA